LARFRQIDLDKPTHQHDALEFSNGTIVLVTDLAPGQKATVLQLPTAKPIEKSDGLEQAELTPTEGRHQNSESVRGNAASELNSDSAQRNDLTSRR
jgi:hypothetical protein